MSDVETLLCCISFIIIVLNNLIWILIYRKKNKKLVMPITNKFEDIQNDLMKIINYKCYIAYQRVLQPLVDKSIKGTPLINDKIVNKITLEITKEILDEMSLDYLNKLKSIYNKDKMEDVLLELVYNTITEMSLSINKRSIKKMNRINIIKSFTTRDIDSTEDIY